MYSRIQRNGKSTTNSSARNPFAPRPFKVEESVPQQNLSESDVIQNQELAPKSSNIDSKSLLSRIAVTRPEDAPPLPRPGIQMKLGMGGGKENYQPLYQPDTSPPRLQMKLMGHEDDNSQMGEEQGKSVEEQVQANASPNFLSRMSIERLPLQPIPAPPRLQMKLTIGQPGDKYEQEADRVAKDVVQRINSTDNQDVQRKLAETSLVKANPWLARMSIHRPEDQPVHETPRLQMKMSIREPGEEQAPTFDQQTNTPVLPLIQRVNIGGMTASPDVEAGIQRARSGGQPIADNIREPMEQAFGADFSGVRVHTDSQADQLNQSIQAKAFTTGQDVFFRQGAYEPVSRGGQELLAHELTHVVQQNGEAVMTSPFPTKFSSKSSSHASSEERITDTPCCRGGGGQLIPQRVVCKSSDVIQRDVDFTIDHFMEWLLENGYEEYDELDKDDDLLRQAFITEKNDISGKISETQFYKKYIEGIFSGGLDNSEGKPCDEELAGQRVRSRTGAAPRHIRSSTYAPVPGNTAFIGETASQNGYEYECGYCDESLVVEKGSGKERDYVRGSKNVKCQPPVAHPREMPFAYVTDGLLALGATAKKRVGRWGSHDTWKKLKKYAGWEFPQVHHQYMTAHTLCNSTAKDTPFAKLSGAAKKSIMKGLNDWIKRDATAKKYWVKLP
ncbi:hypothetical protein NIES2109_61030 (plasmid) [Nostoc sp. HK-01]|nr:hypothetical protein NIES2109_61030 [Nostoc sp. HK-01]